MHSPHPIHRALVTYSDITTGEIRVKIPALLGANSEVSISYIGRKLPWIVPAIGDQIVVMADDENLTNVFWVQIDPVSGGWANTQSVIPFASATDGMGVLQPSTPGKLIYNTGSQTVFVNNTTAFAVGQSVDFARLNSGTFTVIQASGATVNCTPANTLRAQYSAASLICTATNVYLLIGDLG
jgi:phage baseplate assembly protein gpV